MDKIRILLADDTLIAREGWKRILEAVGDIEVVGEVTTAQSTLAKVKELRPDVLLMDLKWLGDRMAGALEIARIRRESPQTKIVAITAYDHLIPEARRAGADAALPKGFSRSELVDLVRTVHNLPPNLPPDRGSTDRTSPARLAAGIGIPTLGFVIVLAELVWAIQSLSTQQFLLAVMTSTIVYFFGVVFAGRYVDVIGETTTYKLFIKILDLFGIKLPQLPLRPRQDDEETTLNH